MEVRCPGARACRDAADPAVRARLAGLAALATDRGLAMSTFARQLLSQPLAREDDLKGAPGRMERDLSAVRRRALSA